tara:strand:+ start:137 stop:634 length:498 start_codon:yes stop_codon:yes gene_type:complete
MDHERLADIVDKYPANLDISSINSSREIPGIEDVHFQIQTTHKILEPDPIDAEERVYQVRFTGLVSTKEEGVTAEMAQDFLRQEVTGYFGLYLTEGTTSGRSQIVRVTIPLERVLFEEVLHYPERLENPPRGKIPYGNKVGDLNMEAQGSITYPVPNFLNKDKAA